MYLHSKLHSFCDILEQKKVHWGVKRQNIFYYVCMKERERADVWIENKYFGRIWVRLSWKLQYPWIKTEKIKISPIVKDRELLSPLKKERGQIIKSNVKVSKRVEGKKIKESVSSNQQHWRRERHQIDQQWAGTMLKKKKEDLLAIKLNCLGHIWQDKCELEAANIAQIYFYLLEISQPQMWRRNGISNRLSIMTGSGLTTTRTKMHCCLWKPTKTLCCLFSKKKSSKPQQVLQQNERWNRGKRCRWFKKRMLIRRINHSGSGQLGLWLTFGAITTNKRSCPLIWVPLQNWISTWHFGGRANPQTRS